MSNFTVRVELYGSPSEDIYTKLHAGMAANGFFRSFSQNGTNYSMPHATYIFFNGTSTAPILKAAISGATASTWKDFAILVTETTSALGIYNLKKA
jgi:hypothetical protein